MHCSEQQQLSSLRQKPIRFSEMPLVLSVLHIERQEDLQPEKLHHALKYGAPSTDNLRFFRNFVLSYDTRLRNPKWVMEHITRKQNKGDGNRYALHLS